MTDVVIATRMTIGIDLGDRFSLRLVRYREARAGPRSSALGVLRFWAK